MKPMLPLLFVFAIGLSCTSGGPETAVGGPAFAPEPETAGPVIPETEIGLAPGSVFEQPAQSAIPFNTADPGDSELQPPPSAEFPPVIPHSVEGFERIELDDNPCLGCHAPDVAADMGAIPVPASHRIDLRGGGGAVDGAVVGARWVCTSCHVTRTGVKPRVAVVRE